MNKIFKILSMALSLFLFSCDEDKEVDTLKISELTEIEFGKTVENSKFDLSLRVENISDSRCPIGVMCFWEGNASVEFNLTTKNKKHNFTLDRKSVV